MDGFSRRAAVIADTYYLGGMLSLVFYRSKRAQPER